MRKPRVRVAEVTHPGKWRSLDSRPGLPDCSLGAHWAPLARDQGLAQTGKVMSGLQPQACLPAIVPASSQSHGMEALSPCAQMGERRPRPGLLPLLSTQPLRVSPASSWGSYLPTVSKTLHLPSPFSGRTQALPKTPRKPSASESSQLPPILCTVPKGFRLKAS